MSASRPIRPLAAGLLGVALGVLATASWGALSERRDLRASEGIEARGAATSLSLGDSPGGSSAESTDPAFPPGHPTCPFAHASSSPREAGSPSRCPALRERLRPDHADRSPAPAQPGIVPGSIGEAARATTIL